MSRRRRPRQGARRPFTLSLAAVLLAVGAALGLVGGYLIGKGRGALGEYSAVTGALGGCRVLFIDQLGSDYPNASLVEHVVGELERAGCSVTLLPSSSFTLRSFKLFGYYDVIIFRGHTGWGNYYYPSTGRLKVLVGFFTGERYNSSKYVDLQRRGLVVEGIPLLRPRPGYNKTYIAVTQDYIRRYVPVKKGSTFILATCFAGSKILAGILLEKGASTVIGWDKNVTVFKADAALEKLVDLYAKYHSWRRAYEELPEAYKESPGGARLVIYTRGGEG